MYKNNNINSLCKDVRLVHPRISFILWAGEALSEPVPVPTLDTYTVPWLRLPTSRGKL